MTTPSIPTPEALRWQFSIRGLLLIVTAFTILCACSARYGGIALAIYGSGLLATVALAPAAWRIIQTRAKYEFAKPPQVKREKFAFGCGITSVFPYSAFLLSALLDPFESHHALLHFAGGLLLVYSLLSYVPIVLALVISLATFWGFRQNPPLLAMRLVGLILNTWWFVFAGIMRIVGVI